ncbi:Coiled-coil domain-containing protein 94 [Fasciola gigantica]|uniref:Splicing factor YJU2 n=1 Tax=Fasciola gigantica TaxID=46835 RepID=A0A504Y834_FASGI|nr:Coiled-coil domain-containing protein 94 [Fasciola gigantica]
MTERKVLNKYFPPDYDPSKIPRIRKGDRRRQFNIRTMAPFNMRCLTCNGYIYKAKKFNSRMETAENVDYLGLRHYRFYIRCPSCCAEIIWRTDLENGDYVLEAGAKRNFEALKTAEELEAKRQAEEEEELANNPMKLLEKRTDQSKQEMEMVEVIEDLKQLNKRQAGMEADHLLLRKLWQEQEAQKKAEEEGDEALIKEILSSRDAISERTNSDSTDAPEDKIIIIEPTIPVPKTRNLITPVQKPSTSSYMKRQLQGAVCVKKNTTVKQPFSSKPSGSLSSSCSSLSSSNSTVLYTSTTTSNNANALPEQGLSEVKRARLCDAGSPVREIESFGIPGISYSDHSDSD